MGVVYGVYATGGMEKGMKSRVFLFLLVLGVVLGCSYTHQEIPPPWFLPSGSGSQVFIKPFEILASCKLGIPEAFAKPSVKPEELQLKKSEGDSDTGEIAPLEPTSSHDLDFEMNNRIQWWIKRFAGPLKKHFRAELATFDTVRPSMEKIFASYGIPKDMVFLCMIESGGRPNAVSPAGATGYWQFTADTARNYKLTVNTWVDERRDMIKSTHAAARYLKALYAIFNDWLLASAAYNAGEGNLYRIMKNHPEINNYWDISHHMPIKHETLDYIPKLIATIVLAKNRAYYGLDESDRKNAVAYDTVRVPSLTYLEEIADLLGVPNKQICLLNAELVKKCTPPSENGHVLKVPEGTADAVEEYIRSQGNRKSREAVKAREKKLEKSGEKVRRQEDAPEEGEEVAKASGENATLVVKKGDTLYRIARENSLTVQSLREANDLAEGQALSIGRELVIPGKKKDAGGSGEKNGERASAGDKPGKGRTHVVAGGETLKGISRRYGTSVKELLEANNLDNADSLQPRMVLNIPGGKGGVPSGSSPSAQDAPPAGDIQYKVRKGDTIWGISKRFAVSARDVLTWNKLSPGAKIQPGDELTIRRR